MTGSDDVLGSANLSWTPAWRLAELIRRRELSPVELVRHVVDRIDRIDPLIHAFITVDAEGALTAARDAEVALVGEEALGALHGVPVAVKDNLSTAGLRTTAGSMLFGDHVPREDAIAVERLRRAGAIVIGKTNTPEFAAFPRTLNRLVPECVNPWNPRHVTGASSGGSAAAVVSGLVPLALGTDGGGSIRIPAALCGAFGFFPAPGRVPNRGLIAPFRFDSIGPITNDVRDAALAMQVMAGPDVRDPSALPGAIPQYLNDLDGGLAGLRIAWLTDIGSAPADPGVVASARAGLAAFQAAGASIDEPAVHIREIWDDFMAISAGAGRYENRPSSYLELPEFRAAAAEPGFADRLCPYTSGAAPSDVADRFDAVPSAADFETAQRRRADLVAQFQRLFASFDLLVSPTMAVTAPVVPLGWANPFASMEQYLKFTVTVNYTENAAASLPCGFVDGLPVGLQLIGPAEKEALLMRACHVFEQMCPWSGHHPGLATMAT